VLVVILPDVNECAVRNGSCEQTCVNTDGSFQCSCRDGFKLSDNKLSCEGKSHTIRISDVNECAVRNGSCEQTCVNTDGSFQCSCRDGFKLSDNKLSCEGKSYTIRING
ncbi:hypothetical protein LSAT2_009363, partial [Lamellibrachia satsuma]